MTIIEVFYYVLIFIIIVFLVNYHWKRRALYNISSKLPGPQILPLLGNTHNLLGNTKEILSYFFYLFNTYGPTFRYWVLNRLYIVVTEPKDLKIIFNSTTCLEKDHYTYKNIIPYVGYSIITAPLEKWKKNRKILNHTFKKKLLDTFIPTYDFYFNNLIHNLEKHTGYFDAYDDINRCALEVLLDNLMGLSMDVQNNDNYFKSIEQALEIVCLKMYNPWLQFDFIFNLSKYGKRQKDIIKVFHAFSRHIIDKKKEDINNKLDGLSHKKTNLSLLEKLLEFNKYNSGCGLTDQEISEEVNNLMIAGTDTTAGTSAFVMVMLGMHPDVQEKVYAEVMGILGPTRILETNDLNEFKYTSMVVKETLRLFPSVPIIYRKITEELKLDSCVVPAGCAIMIPILLTHRNPKIWPEPLKFDPDRFLAEEVFRRHSYSWIPFSGGSRNCIGFQFAMNEIKALIANVVRKFKIKTTYKKVEDIQLKVDLFLKPVYGHTILLEART